MSAGQLPIMPLTESEWQQQLVELAELHGWQWCHWRAARTAHGWRTPVSGPIGAGFPDLLLVHPRRQRVLFVEVKSDTGRLAPEQRAVHDVLRTAGLDVRVFRPADWDALIEVLR
jgi:hypothetical protein